jgi:hypothetical protein
MANFEVFMQKVMRRPIPINPMTQIKTLAKELAEGLSENLWAERFTFDVGYQGAPKKFDDDVMNRYIQQRWGENYPNLNLLVINNYLTQSSATAAHIIYRINKAAFDLIDETQTSTVFISYRRKESSAFALLVLARLKEQGLDAFLDMSMQAGDNWHAHVKERIESHDFFIVLLNHETLASEVVRDEIQWAMDAKKIILPIAHPEFDYAEYKKLRTDEGTFK